MKMMKKAQQGFTLIELMIVVAIIGILASIAIPAYQDYMTRAKWAKAVSTMAAVKLAIGECLNDNSGEKSVCDDVSQVGLELQKYGITALPAGTGTSDGNPAPASDPNADWVSMTLGNAGAADASIIIQGDTPLAKCKITFQPTVDKAAGTIKWTPFAESTDAAADEAKCTTFVKGAIAGGPV